MSWRRRYGGNWGRLGLIFEKATIGDVASVQTGPFGSQLHNNDYVLVGTPIVTVEHLGQRKMTRQNLPCVSDTDKLRLNKYWLEYGDLVFSRVGSVDRCSWVSEDEDGWLFSGRCLRVRPLDKSAVYHKYLYYFFTLDETKNFIRNIAVGATMPSINTQLLSEVPISLPAFSTQKEIADTLSTIDDKIEANRAINRYLELMAQVLFAKFMENNSGVPIKLHTLCNFQEGYVNPSQSRPEYFDGTVKWLRAVDINESYIFDTSRTLTDAGFASAGKSALLFKPGTIAISKSGTIGRLGLVADYMCGNRAVINISPHDVNLLPFIYLYLKSRQAEFLDLAVGSVQKNLYVPLLQDLDIDLPPRASVLTFCEKAHPLFEHWKNNVAENHNLAILRDSLLPRLMSGEVTITD